VMVPLICRIASHRFTIEGDQPPWLQHERFRKIAETTKLKTKTGMILPYLPVGPHKFMVCLDYFAIEILNSVSGWGGVFLLGRINFSYHIGYLCYDVLLMLYLPFSTIFVGSRAKDRASYRNHPNIKWMWDCFQELLSRTQ